MQADDRRVWGVCSGRRAFGDAVVVHAVNRRFGFCAEVGRVDERSRVDVLPASIEAMRLLNVLLGGHLR